MKELESILQKGTRCLICGKYEPLQVHHVMNGPKRKKSTKWKLVVYLCPECHEMIHTHQSEDIKLKQFAQKEFELLYGHRIWMNEFRKNYL